jgi:hypothetical protein
MRIAEAKPISELKLGMMNQNEVARIQGYLERKLHCSMTYMSVGCYLVSFPDGTLEVACSDSNPKYQHESIITLLNGVTLRKLVHWPCTRPGCTHTHLLLPDEQEDRSRRLPYGNH